MITEDQKTELVFELSADLRELGKHVVVRLSKGDIDVPLFPAIATEVMRLANSPESDAASLADLIQSDPNLAGHVMRVANSALYTPKASMVSLQQAIARLGMNLICEISLGVALNAKLFNAPGYENRLSDISQHGFCSALWSKEIARASQENVESAFLCGLLHGIGRAAFLQMFSDMAVMNGIKLDANKVRELEDV
ncbi:HDOD domain-containing protein, partial [Oleiphilus sp. HI0080]